MSTHRTPVQVYVKVLWWICETHPYSVYLGQQFRIILLHSFQTLEHGSDMRLAQQKGIIWKAKRSKERDEEMKRDIQ